MYTLKVGEVREVGFQFFSNSTFTINTATYTVQDSQNNQIDSGTAQINNSNVFILYTAAIAGNFNVNFRVSIDEEIYEPHILVCVTTI